MTASRKGPLRLGPEAFLSPDKRRLACALRHEARHPTVRLSYAVLAGWLFLASWLGLAAGVWLGRTL